MADLLIQIILAIVQGITEFLPLSSSGHLALIQNLVSYSDIAFDVLLHLGSLVAVVYFSRREIFELLHFRKKDLKMILFLFIATIPAALVGYFFSSYIAIAFSSLLFIGLGFLFNGFILFFTKYASEDKSLNFWRALVIGLWQAIAILPGVSRSGMTISSAKFFGIDEEKAMRFSFLLFIPVVLGATLLELKEWRFNFSLFLIIPFLVSVITSFVFMKVLQRIIYTRRFWMFSFYCWFIGIITLILFVISLL
jgi:undecaprenyl-diphosphatase